MDPKCTHLVSADTDAATLCDWILSSAAYTVALIDDNGNGVPEVQEIFNTAIEIAESEESAVFDSATSTESFPFSDYIINRTSFRIPWLLADHAPNAPRNVSLLSQVSSDIRSMKEDLQESGFAPNTLNYNETLARSLLDYVFDENGLNIEHVNSSSQEWTAVEALTQSHEADCSELSMIYYELCRLAGLDAKIIQVIKDRHGHYRVNHICMALYLDPENTNNMTMLDLVESTPFLPTPHSEWVTLSKLEVISIYRMNLGLKPPPTIVEQGAKALFEFGLNELHTALSYSPHLPLLLYNIGRHYMHYVLMGSDFINIAKSYFERAQQLAPDDPFIRGELDVINSYMGQ